MRTTLPQSGGVTGPAGPPGAGPTRIEERTILLHGQQVTYLESGAERGGPVVVLLHGLAGSSSTWLPVMPLLGAHAHVIAPDLLGHGQSAKPGDGDYSLGAHAAGLRDLLVALRLDRATVITRLQAARGRLAELQAAPLPDSPPASGPASVLTAGRANLLMDLDDAHRRF